MIYLDNAATTKPCRAAVEAMIASADMFANPSSLYGIGLDAEKQINEARGAVAKAVGVPSKNIYFTSGGTEANNMIILGAAEAMKRYGTHVITTKIEHPSVLEAFKRLEQNGYTVTYLTPDKDGRISIDELKSAADKETTLISVMHVNNETGVIQPVEEIKDAVRDIAPNALIHSDCVQSFGKIAVNARKLNADFITVSAHKIHGFKGCGAAYISDMRKIKPLILGGSQQDGIRPGTENVGGIMAFGAAVREMKPEPEKMRELRLLFKDELAKRLENIKFNGSDEHSSGSVLNVSILGVRAEILLHSLEARGVYVSTGSACSTHKPEPSHVLTAMGLNNKEIDGAIRLSLSRDTTADEIKTAAQIIAEEAANIRRIMR